MTKFQKNSSLQRKKGSSKSANRTPENIGNVRQVTEQTPTTSMPQLAQQMCLSYETCRAILRKDLAPFPYRVTCVQELHEIDFLFSSKVDYLCQWFLV